MRNFLVCLFFGILVFQGTGSAVELLVIDSQKGDPYHTVRLAMVSELESLGFSRGHNLDIRYWTLGNKAKTAKRVWMEESHKQYDAIFVNGTVAAMSLKALACDLPGFRFFFGAVTDPVGLGLIKDFTSPPAGNFTGVCYPVKVEDRLRFIMQAIPKARRIGFVYADMPQSASYVKWLKAAIETAEFNYLDISFRKVPFVKSEGGHKRMALLAKEHVRALDSTVDLFLSPNDQMGAQAPFSRMVWETASKPLVGLGRKDVMEGWGATLALYPSLPGMGQQVARMMVKSFNGEGIEKITPEWPVSGMAFDLKKASRFGIEIPPELIGQAGENIIR